MKLKSQEVESFNLKNEIMNKNNFIDRWMNEPNTMRTYIPQRTRILAKSWINARNLNLFLLLNLLSKDLNV